MFSAVVFVLLLYIQLITGVDQSQLMFTNTVCSGEDFVTDAFLPALRLAIKDVNNKILMNWNHQLTLCNSYDLQSNHTMHVSFNVDAQCTRIIIKLSSLLEYINNKQSSY